MQSPGSPGKGGDDWWVPRDEDGKQLTPEAAVEEATSVLVDGTAPLLDLAYRQIGPECFRKFSTALTLNRTVTKLDLTCNSLGDEGAKDLFRAVSRFTSVSKLNVAGNFIGAPGAEALARCLRVNTSLDKISLFHNEIGDAGALALAAAFHGGEGGEDNNTLTHLNLRENCITNAGMAPLIRAIAPEHNTALVVLWVGNNVRTPDPVDSEELGLLQEEHQQQARIITQEDGLFHNDLSADVLQDLRKVLTDKAAAVRGPQPTGKKKDKKKDKSDGPDPEKMFWTPPGTPRDPEADEQALALEKGKGQKDPKKKGR